MAACAEYDSQTLKKSFDFLNDGSEIKAHKGKVGGIVFGDDKLALGFFTIARELGIPETALRNKCSNNNPLCINGMVR